MKSLIKTTVLSLLTATSLSLSFVSQSPALVNNQASVNRLNQINNKTIDYSQSDTLINQLETTETQEVAYTVYCETRWINGVLVECCIDSYGNWACVY